MDAADAIERAIKICGTQGALAERSKLSQQYISKLLVKKTTPSTEAAIAISRATGGEVRIRDLLPDVVEAVAAELEREARRVPNGVAPGRSASASAAAKVAGPPPARWAGSESAHTFDESAVDEVEGAK